MLIKTWCMSTLPDIHSSILCLTLRTTVTSAGVVQNKTLVITHRIDAQMMRFALSILLTHWETPRSFSRNRKQCYKYRTKNIMNLQAAKDHLKHLMTRNVTNMYVPIPMYKSLYSHVSDMSHVSYLELQYKGLIIFVLKLNMIWWIYTIRLQSYMKELFIISKLLEHDIILCIYIWHLCITYLCNYHYAAYLCTKWIKM